MRRAAVDLEAAGVQHVIHLGEPRAQISALRRRAAGVRHLDIVADHDIGMRPGDIRADAARQQRGVARDAGPGHGQPVGRPFLGALRAQRFRIGMAFQNAAHSAHRLGREQRLRRQHQDAPFRVAAQQPGGQQAEQGRFARTPKGQQQHPPRALGDLLVEPARNPLVEGGCRHVLAAVPGVQEGKISGSHRNSVAWWRRDGGRLSPECVDLLRQHGERARIGDDDIEHLLAAARIAVQQPGGDPNATSSLSEATQLCRQVAAQARKLRLPAIHVEKNGLGAFLPGILKRQLDRKGCGTTVQGVHNHRPKHERILEAFDAPLAARALWAHASVFESPFLRELKEWRPRGRGRDDGLDAAACALLAEPYRFGPHGRAPRKEWRPAARPRRARRNFHI